jgi:hypothetical protein
MSINSLKFIVNAIKELDIEKKLELERTVFDCMACGGKTDIPTSKKYALRGFRRNDGTYQSVSLFKWQETDNQLTPIPKFLACSEICRKALIRNGVVGYKLLMEWPDWIVDEIYAEDEKAKFSAWADDPEHITQYRVVKKWLDTYPNFVHGWQLIGNLGTGKSCFASAIAHEVRKLEMTVLFTNGLDIRNDSERLNARSYEYSENYDSFLEKYLSKDVIIIDEFTDIDFSSRPIVNLFMKLHAKKKILVITANGLTDEWEKNIDPRIFSRIIQDCKPLLFLGEDKRKKY